MLYFLNKPSILEIFQSNQETYRKIIDYTRNIDKVNYVDLSIYKDTRLSDFDSISRKEFLEQLKYNSTNVCEQTISMSLIPSIYGNFEYYLLTLCRFYELNIEGIIPYEEYKEHEGIRRSVKYLLDIVGFRNNQHYINSGQLWCKIISWSDVRNCIIHNGGEINKKLLTKIDELKTIVDIEEFEFAEGIYNIYVDLKSCESLLSLINEYVTYVFSVKISNGRGKML